MKKLDLASADMAATDYSNLELALQAVGAALHGQAVPYTTDQRGSRVRLDNLTVEFEEARAPERAVFAILGRYGLVARPA